MEKVRFIKLFKNYYKEFYVAQTKVVRDKINFVLQMVETQRMIPKKFFRIIEGSDGIYEIKVEIESNIYRIFCCLDEGAVVVLFHGYELLNAEYGERGTETRERYEAEADAFCLAECLKEQRRLAGLTQEQLATKIGTKKSYISKIENGHADVQLSTLFRIFAGLGRRVSLTVL